MHGAHCLCGMTGRVRHTIGHFVRAGFGGIDLARGFNLGVEQAVGGLGGMGTRLEVFLSLEHIGVFGSVEADDDLAGAAVGRAVFYDGRAAGIILRGVAAFGHGSEEGRPSHADKRDEDKRRGDSRYARARIARSPAGVRGLAGARDLAVARGLIEARGLAGACRSIGARCSAHVRFGRGLRMMCDLGASHALLTSGLLWVARALRAGCVSVAIAGVHVGLLRTMGVMASSVTRKRSENRSVFLQVVLLNCRAVVGGGAFSY